MLVARPEMLNPLFSSLSSLKGVGPQLEALFNRFFLIHKGQNAIALDVLMHMPSQSIDRRAQVSIANAHLGDIVTLKLHIDRHQPPPKGRPSMPHRVFAHDASESDSESGEISLVFFKTHGNWVEKSLPVGEVRYVCGQIAFFNGEKQITHPDYILSEDKLDSLPLVEPVYPLTQGLSSKALRKVVEQVMAKLPDLPEWILAKRMGEFNWPSFSNAMKMVHAPTSPKDTELTSPARMRLAYDEYLAGQLTLQIIRSTLVKQKGEARVFSGELTMALKNALPFSLTKGQNIAIEQILADIGKPDKMSRLLQGDVGSGKTIVAMMAMAAVAESGAQSAIMTPTEILASQHYATLKPLCEAIGLNIVLLTGKQKVAIRRPTLAGIKDGSIDIIVGTHALFQAEVEFFNLGLSVVDEQHRFGVHQRLALSKKGEKSDLLVMTATPIPRSLVLTHFGDMDVSILKEKPAGRQVIDTAILSISELQRVVARLKNRIEEGAQAFWVCPLVEQSDLLDLVSAQDRFNELKKVFGDKVALVHGRMSAKEKTAIMERFVASEIKILVATTVIEVGVDVPNASIMIIEHAERFGLSQLHQLRGRVGRGEKRSACLLLYKEPLNETAKARLDTIKNTDDGFIIAQKDLELRGEGDVLGTRQSGMPGYNLAVPDVHRHLLEKAHIDAKEIFANNPNLSGKQGEAIRTLLYIFRKDLAIPLIKSG